MKSHLRLVLTIGILVVLGALIIQNHESVQVRLFLVRLEMPLILLLALTSGLGFILGLLATYFGKIKVKNHQA